MRNFNAVKSSTQIEHRADRWMTVEAWAEDGYYIIKGQRALLRSTQGLPLFNEHQVREQPDIVDDRPGT